MRDETEFVAFHTSHWCDATLQRRSAVSLRRFLRHREQYSGHSRQVAGRHRQLEVLIDPLQSSEDRTADRRSPRRSKDRCSDPAAAS